MRATTAILAVLVGFTGGASAVCAYAGELPDQTRLIDLPAGTRIVFQSAIALPQGTTNGPAEESLQIAFGDCKLHVSQEHLTDFEIKHGELASGSFMLSGSARYSQLPDLKGTVLPLIDEPVSFIQCHSSTTVSDLRSAFGRSKVRVLSGQSLPKRASSADAWFNPMY